MSYIGNTPFTAAFLTDTFSGDGSDTTFTLSAAPANTSSIIVAVSGVLQDPSTYSVSGTTLTFSAAPPTGTDNISVRFLGIPASGVTTTAYRTVTEFTATAGQTSFSVPSYTAGYVDVYRNGVMLGTADFTATSGTTVVLASGATAGDLIRVESFYVSSVLNAIQATAGAVNSTYIADSAVTTAKIDDAAVTQAKLGANVAGNGPAFRLRLANAGAYQATNNTWTVVPLDETVFSEGTNAINLTGSTQTVNGVSVQAYGFAPTVAGWYQINFSGGCYSLSSGTGRIAVRLIDESGALVSPLPTIGIGYSNIAASSSFIKYMNGTSNTLRLSVNQNNGADRPFDYSDYNTVDVCLIKGA